LKINIIYSILILSILNLISIPLFSQNENLMNEKIISLKVDKQERSNYTKNTDGTKTFWKDSAVYGFSIVTEKSSQYYSLHKIGEFGKFKNLLLNGTKGHEPSHKFAKGAINAKYARKISWILAFGGMIPFLVTFYDNPNFENQKMRWTGGGIMIGGFLSVVISQSVHENKITKACRAF
jgi:hypothetical protein